MLEHQSDDHRREETRRKAKIVYPSPNIDLDADARDTNFGGDAIIIEQELPGFGMCWGVYNGFGILYFPIDAGFDGPWQGYFQGPESELLVPARLNNETHWFGDDGWLARRIYFLRAAIHNHLEHQGYDGMINVHDRLAEVLKNPGFHQIVAAAACEAALKTASTTLPLGGPAAS